MRPNLLVLLLTWRLRRCLLDATLPDNTDDNTLFKLFIDITVIDIHAPEFLSAVGMEEHGIINPLKVIQRDIKYGLCPAKAIDNCLIKSVTI